MLKLLRSLRDGLSNLFRVLSPCRYSVLILLIGAVSFLVVPQGQDVLRRMAEWDLRQESALKVFGTLAVFVFSTLVWAASTWYWARVILYLSPSENPAQDKLREWAPRWMGFLALLSMAAALLVASFNYRKYITDNGGLTGGGPILRLQVLAAALFVLSLVFLALVAKRRDIMRSVRARRDGRTMAEEQPAPAHQEFPDLRRLPEGTKRAVVWSLLASVVLGLLFAIGPIFWGQMLGTLPIVLLTAANWVLFGTGLLYLSRQARFPLLLLLLVPAAMFSRCNDNHAMRLVENGSPPKRPTIQEQFQSWSRGRDPRKPIFIVAAEGGGIRAAYWAAVALGKLEDDHPGFARQVFAISGVSGGSLGGAVFSALVAEKESGKDLSSCGRLRGCASEVLGADFLSPTVARMVAPDLVQRFWFHPLPFTDRAQALEDGWADAWGDVVSGEGPNRFDQAFLQLWEGGAATVVPSLMLNGTHVESGRRIVTTNLTWNRDELRDAYDLLQVLGPPDPAQAADLPLKTAVHASARFTYVSPAGTMRPEDAPRFPWWGHDRGHVVDGGYFENSGTATALELVNAIRQVCENHCEGRLYMIYLRNSPTTDPKAEVDPGDPDETLDRSSMEEEEGAGAEAAEENEKDLEPFSRSYPRLNELLSPPRALLNTRGARGSLAVKTACVEMEGGPEPCRPREKKGGGRQGNRAVAPRPRRYFEIGLCETVEDPEHRRGLQRAPLPLGWQLSGTSRKAMDDQLEPGFATGCPELRNSDTLRAIGALVRNGIPQGNVMPQPAAAPSSRP